MFYAGIGSRKTPEEIGVKITKIASDLEKCGYTLRSGGAEGADSYFEAGANKKEIYLPWRGFNDNSSQFHNVGYTALEIAQRHHSGWDRLSEPVKKLMGRNAYQVLGIDLKTPVDFLVCWTDDGCETDSERTKYTGGTGLAISIASRLNIPVYNIANEESLEMLIFLINNL